jgi:SAM-dependent methyltransferase
MVHADHIALLEGVPGLRERLGLPLRGSSGLWADLGCGEGAFTLALADLLDPGARIYAVDRDRAALARLAQSAHSAPRLTTLAADFIRPFSLPVLDGIVMANALHFVPYHEQPVLLERLCANLRTGGQFLLVEYNANQGNHWVPYPLTLGRWQRLASGCGFTQPIRLAGHPSHFLDEIYAAVCQARPQPTNT